jgi:predicted permease
MYELISRIIPIILLISLGVFIRRKRLLREESINDIKRFLLDFTLPAVLFISFINIKLEKGHLFLVAAITAMAVLIYYAGVALNKIKSISHPLLPLTISGFTFGLLGAPLFQTVFGIENLQHLSILDVGNEFFMWIFLVTVLKTKYSHEKFSFKIIMDFLKHPIIQAVFWGILFNILGFADYFSSNFLLNGIYSAIRYIADISIPFILIVIGYMLRFNKAYLRKSAVLTLVRYAVMLLVGYAFKFLVIDRFIRQSDIFNYAYFTFLILPAPYSLSVLLDPYFADEDKELLSNVLVMNTVVCISIFLGFVAVLGM